MLGERDGGAESTRNGAALRRGFLAVVPPAAVLRWTESVVDSARRTDDGLRWTRPEQWHLTLQFLGRVDELDSLTESVAESVRGVEKFAVQLGGAGAFPAAAGASVVWLGVSTGAAELGALAGAIAAATAPLGFIEDDRPFRPHLTVARAHRACDARSLVERLWTGPAGPPWTVEQIVLFESETRATGAVHAARASFRLNA